MSQLLSTLYRRILTRLTAPAPPPPGFENPDPNFKPSSPDDGIARKIPIHIPPPLTLNEACQILNVVYPKPRLEGTDLSTIEERYKKLYDKNEEAVGGSFYLQSKVVMARDRIVEEVRKKEEEMQREAELEKGWKPKLFRR